MSATGPVTPVEARCAPFPSTRLRGYDQDAVDDLLDDVADALHAVGAGRPPALSADRVVAAELPRAPLGHVGYRRREVDELLDRVADTLEDAA